MLASFVGENIAVQYSEFYGIKLIPKYQTEVVREFLKTTLFLRSIAFGSKMSLLYLIKFTIEYKRIPQEQFIKTWAAEAEVALKAKEKGKILQIWKVGIYFLKHLSRSSLLTGCCFFKFSQEDQKVLVINHKFITTKKTQTLHNLRSVQVWDNTALVSGNNSL